MPRYPVRPTQAEQTSRGGTAAVDRALTVLCAFREADPPLPLIEISARAQLVPSTTLRLLASLTHFGLVLRHADGRYTLGPATARLHHIYTNTFNLERLVVPALQKLATLTTESASFQIRQGKQRLVLFRVSSTRVLTDRSHAGDLLPLERGSGGHVLMAFSGREGGALHDEIRRTGYMAAPIGDRAPELAGISAAVFDARSAILGTVTLTMPTQRYSASFIEYVVSTANELTLAIGGKTLDVQSQPRSKTESRS